MTRPANDNASARCERVWWALARLWLVSGWAHLAARLVWCVVQSTTTTPAPLVCPEVELWREPPPACYPEPLFCPMPAPPFVPHPYDPRAPLTCDDR